jgi:DNA-binding beta-propeller fold protein YncE
MRTTLRRLGFKTAVALLAAAALATLLATTTIAAAAPYVPVGDWPSLPSLRKPVDVSVALDGEVFVADADGARIAVLGPDGAFRRAFDGSDVWGETLVRPSSVTIGPDARVYVTDSLAEKVSVFERSGAFVRSWGGAGTGNGQFRSPQALAFDASGNIYVAEMLNNRVQVFSAAGAWLRTFGSPTATTFSAPLGVAVLDGEVYVAEAGNRRISVITPAGALVRTIGITLGNGSTPTTSRYLRPSAVKAHPAGGIVVTDAGTQLVERCTATGSIIATVGGGTLSQPDGVGVDSAGNLLVADTLNNRVTRYAPSPMTLLGFWSFSSAGSALGSYNAPKGIAQAADGGAFVADSGNNRVVRLDSAGVPIVALGTATLSSPTGVAVSADGTEVFVADTGNNRIVVLGTDGSVKRFIGTGVLSAPAAVACTTGGAVAVADTGNDRVVVFTSAGVQTQVIGAGSLQRPQGVAFGPAGDIYVSDTEHHRVTRFSAAGAVLDTIGGFGDVPGQFTFPANLVVTSAGEIIVADRGNSRVQRFSESGAFLEALGGLGSSRGRHATPYGVALSTAGTLLVADTGNNRVVRWGFDTDLPRTTASGVFDTWTNQPVTVSFSAQDAGTGPGATYYRLAGGATQRYFGPFQVSAEGNNALVYWTVDRAGNKEANRSTTVRIDYTAPSGTFSVNGGSISTSSTTVIANAAITGADEMRYDSGTGWGAWKPYTPLTTHTFPGEGPRTVKAQFRDFAGNVTDLSATITVDLTGPAVTIWNQPAGGISIPPVDITLTAADAYSPIDTIRYTVDGGASRIYDGSFTVGGLGWHTVAAYAVDTLGNVGPEVSARFKVIGPPPSGTMVVASGQRYVAAADITAVADVQHATEMRWDSGTGFSAWKPFAVTQALVLPAEGDWTVRGEFRDAEGRTLQLSQVVGWDRTGPVTTLSGVADGEMSGVAIEAKLSAVDAMSGVGSIRYSLDGAAESEYTSPIRVGGDGEHTLSYRAIDVLGNAEPAHTIGFIVAENFPSGTQVADGGKRWTNKRTIPLAMNIIHAVKMRHDFGDGAGYTDWRTYGSSASKTYGADGTYTITGQYRDLLGRVFTRVSLITVDTEPPVTTALGIPASGLSALPVTAAFVASDTASPVGRTYYRVDGGKLTAYAAPVTVAAAGEHVLEYFSEDAAGNAETPKSVRFRIDPTAPSGGLVVNGGRPFANSVDISVESSVAGAVQMRIDAGAGFGAWVPYSSAATVTVVGEGVHTIRAAYRTQAGAESTAGATVVVDLTAPQVGGVTVVGRAFSIIAGAPRWLVDLSVSSVDSGTPPSGLSGRGWHLGTRRLVNSSSSASFAGIRNGASRVAVAVSDAAGNAASSATSLVLGKGAAPRPSASSAKRGKAITVTGTAALVPGATYRMLVFKKASGSSSYALVGTVTPTVKRGSGQTVTLQARTARTTGVYRFVWRTESGSGVTLSPHSASVTVR